MSCYYETDIYKKNYFSHFKQMCAYLRNNYAMQIDTILCDFARISIA